MSKNDRTNISGEIRIRYVPLEDVEHLQYLALDKGEKSFNMFMRDQITKIVSSSEIAHDAESFRNYLEEILEVDRILLEKLAKQEAAVNNLDAKLSEFQDSLARLFDD